MPVIHSSKTDLTVMLKERVGVGAQRGNLRSMIIVFEVAVSVVLLIGAGLMLRTFDALSEVDPGFESDQVLTVGLAMPVFAYRSAAQRTEFLTRLQTRLRALPGVQVVGGVYPLPLAEHSRNVAGPYAVDQGNAEEWERQEATYRGTLPGYFEAMGIEVIAGKTFEDTDMLADAPTVAVIDRTMAERNWPDEDAVGKQFYIELPTNLGSGDQRPPIRVIGVVENVRHASLSGFTRETIYFTHRTGGGDLMELTIKATGDPTGLAPRIREEVKAIDPNLPITGIRSMHEYVADALAPTRFVVVLLGVFAVIAVTMAAVGLYGILAFSIRQRTYEMGVRIALGATRSRIVVLVLR